MKKEKIQVGRKYMDYLVGIGLAALWYYHQFKLWNSTEYKRYQELKKSVNWRE